VLEKFDEMGDKKASDLIVFGCHITCTVRYQNAAKGPWVKWGFLFGCKYEREDKAI